MISIQRSQDESSSGGAGEESESEGEQLLQGDEGDDLATCVGARCP